MLEPAEHEAIRLANIANKALESRDTLETQMAVRLRADARTIFRAGTESDNVTDVVLGGLLIAVRREVELAVEQAKEDAKRDYDARISGLRGQIERILKQ